ncbi:hypothetical protein [Chelatococcus reniformis]|uniref:Transmembrane protein n=1 Tax=Chelatococcus reniformis TaxID=1494448 RepID=A0A916X6R6_9HYPH|nr:hypothetical protein [Chelatococcus reniformis]GGC46061.1 hypothetical protein GCM10010994_01490 [Chelatococcus reniformis]
MNAPFAGLARNGFVHVTVAFLAMGSWAAFANRGHPMPAPLQAGLIQGAISASITLILKRAVDALARRFQGIAALVVPPAAAGLVSASLLTAIHTIAGTPEVVATIALPLTVATSYAAVYNFTFWRSGR